jgi:hypothetical protein
MSSEELFEVVVRAAAARNIDPAALMAVIDVESGSRIFARVDGRNEPLIRFEGHYFDRRLSPEKRIGARKAGLSSPKPGGIPNPPAQSDRWRLFRRAAAIDHRAACESVSWGVGQVMGAHWTRLGYANVDELVAAARSGLEGQLDLMLRYLDHAGLIPALRSHDWRTFARGYNGPLFQRNRYAEKLAAAFARNVGRRPTAPASAANRSAGSKPLRLGASGEAVRKLQRLLSAAGHPLREDGVFGPDTDRKLRRFQRKTGLAVDGVAGPATMRALAGDGHPRFRPAWWGWIRTALGAYIRRKASARAEDGKT